MRDENDVIDARRLEQGDGARGVLARVARVFLDPLDRAVEFFGGDLGGDACLGRRRPAWAQPTPPLKAIGAPVCLLSQTP